MGGSGASASAAAGAGQTPASAFVQQMGTGLADAIALRLEEHLGEGQGPLAAGTRERRLSRS